MDYEKEKAEVRVYQAKVSELSDTLDKYSNVLIKRCLESVPHSMEEFKELEKSANIAGSLQEVRAVLIESLKMSNRYLITITNLQINTLDSQIKDINSQISELKKKRK